MPEKTVEDPKSSKEFPAATQGGGAGTTEELPLKWKKIEVLGRPVGALLTALAVAAIGWFGQTWLSVREEEITKRAEIQQDTRLYTELMSRREEAESSLRMGMFSAILGEFLKTTSSAESSDALSESPISTSSAESSDALRNRLVKLELLALNFGDSLSLNPLFLQLAEEIERPRPDSDFWKIERDRFRSRLRSLARRVSGTQLAALSPAGDVLEIDVPLTRAGIGRNFDWPDDAVADEQQALGKDDDWANEEIANRGRSSLDGIERTYQMNFYEADPILQTVRVDLKISESPTNDHPENIRPVEASFELNFFNFPMVDNTRLSGDQRFSLVLEKFNVDADILHVVGICFPGDYASLRDKTFLGDIIKKLEEQESFTGEEESQQQLEQKYQ